MAHPEIPVETLMRSRLSFVWAVARWLLLIFAAATSVEAPLVAHPAEPTGPIEVWEGKASWYGPRFHGRVTANGEVFDMYAATAAHRTLPLGAIVRVVNPRTGTARVVRINDRGPFVEGREIDVSYEVARFLGIRRRGVAPVRIELLEVPENRWSLTRAAD